MPGGGFIRLRTTLVRLAGAQASAEEGALLVVPLLFLIRPASSSALLILRRAFDAHDEAVLLGRSSRTQTITPAVCPLVPPRTRTVAKTIMILQQKTTTWTWKSSTAARAPPRPPPTRIPRRGFWCSRNWRTCSAGSAAATGVATVRTGGKMCDILWMLVVQSNSGNQKSSRGTKRRWQPCSENSGRDRGRRRRRLEILQTQIRILRNPPFRKRKRAVATAAP